MYSLTQSALFYFLIVTKMTEKHHQEITVLMNMKTTVNMVHGVVRDTCRKDCLADKEMCLNHVDMKNFSNKFICLAKLGSCKRKCFSDEKFDVDDNEASSNNGIEIKEMVIPSPALGRK